MRVQSVLKIKETVAGDDQVAARERAWGGIAARGDEDVRGGGEKRARGRRCRSRGRGQDFNRAAVDEACKASDVREV